MEKLRGQVNVASLVGLILLLPGLVGAQAAGDTLLTPRPDVDQAIIDAKYDARHDAQAGLWLGCGMTTLCLGVGAAYLSRSSPRPDRLMGRSSDYVSTYATVYRSKRRSLQTNYAIAGCLFTGCIVTGAVGLALAAEGASDCITCGPAPCVDIFEPIENLAEGCVAGVNCLQGTADCTSDCLDNGCTSPDCSDWSPDCGLGSSSCGSSSSGCGSSSSGCGSGSSCQ